jgi:GT2 family glycosyltransferase
VDVPTVSIIIVSYQSRETIGACLASVAAHAGVSVETIMVDNASSDGAPGLVQDCFPCVRVLQEARNRGFAAACNRGARLATAPYLLFLNPDAELRPGALSSLEQHLAGSPRVAAAGPRFVYPDGREQDSAFTYPSLLMTWLEFFPRPGRLLHTRLNGRITSPDGAPVAVDHPLGACMLVRRSAWDEVGPFDERFFLYCEEVDWCMRAKDRGWTIAHVPAATVVHHGGISSASASAASLAHLYRSRQLLHAKHRSRGFQLAARCITRLGLTQERRRLRRLQAASATPESEVAARLDGVERALQLLR